MSYDPNQIPYIAPYSLYETSNTPHMFNNRAQMPLQQGLFPFGQFGGGEQWLNQMIPSMLGMSPTESMFARFGESHNLIRQQQMFQQQMGRPGSSPSGGALALDRQRTQHFAIGVQQMLQGGPLTREQEMQAQGVGGMLAENMPMMRQVLMGAGVPPQALQNMNSIIYGSRGSAVEFNAYANRTMANMVDVATQQRGLDGDVRARMGENLFRELTDSAGYQNQVRGFGGGQLGEIMEGLSARGQLGISNRSLSIRTQGQQLRGFTEKDFEAAALQTQAGAAFVDSAGRISDQKGFSKVVEDVKKTYSQLKTSGTDLSKTELAGMTGGTELLDMSEAKRVAQKIGEVTQSIKAMDELFKENGQTASLPQLMRAVESLTEGASNFMSSSDTTNFLRNVQQVSGVANMSLDTFNKIRSLGAQTAQQYGGHGVIGSYAAVDAVTQVNASGDAFGVKAFGRMSKEETQQQMAAVRAAGAASFGGQVFGLVTKLGDELNAPAGSEAAAFIEAVRSGDASALTNRSEQEVIGLLTNAGVSRSRIDVLLSDRRGLEAAALENPENFSKFVASSQQTEMISRLANRGSARMGDVLRDAAGGTLDNLSEEEKSRMLFRMSQAATEAAVNMTTAEANDPAVARQRLVDAALSAPGVTPEMRQAILRDKQLGDSLYSSLNAANAQLNGQTIEDTRTIYGNENLKATEFERRRNAVAAASADAASGIGMSSIYAQIGDFIHNSNGTAGIVEATRAVLGGSNAAAIAIADPSGEMAAAFGYQKRMKELDPINNAADFEEWKVYAAVSEGLNKGGSFAAEAAELARKSGITLPAETNKMLATAAADPSQAGDALLQAAGVDKKMLGIEHTAKRLYGDHSSDYARHKAFQAFFDTGVLSDADAAVAADLMTGSQGILATLDANPELLEKLHPEQREVVGRSLAKRKDVAAIEKKYGMSATEVLKTQRGVLTESERKTLANASTASNNLTALLANPNSTVNLPGQSVDNLKKAFDETRGYANADYTKKDEPSKPADPAAPAPPAKTAEDNPLTPAAFTTTGTLKLLVDGTVEAMLMLEKLLKK